MRRFLLLLTVVVVLQLLGAGQAVAAPTIQLSWLHASVINPSGEIRRQCEVTGRFTGFPPNSTITIVGTSTAYGEFIRQAVDFGPTGSFGATVIFSRDFRPFPPGDVTATTFIDSNGNRVQDPSEPTLASATLPRPCEPLTDDDCKNGRFREYVLVLFKNQGDCVGYVATGGRNPATGP